MIRTVRAKGKYIPYDEWYANELKKLRIRRQCASTSAELRSVLAEVERLKTTHRMMMSADPARALQKVAFEMV